MSAEKGFVKKGNIRHEFLDPAYCPLNRGCPLNNYCGFTLVSICSSRPAGTQIAYLKWFNKYDINFSKYFYIRSMHLSKAIIILNLVVDLIKEMLSMLLILSCPVSFEEILCFMMKPQNKKEPWFNNLCVMKSSL